MDCTLPGSSVHRILQATSLEWVAISFSRWSSQPRNETRISCTAGRFFTNRAWGKPYSLVDWRKWKTLETETEQDLAGSWAWKPFCAPQFFFVGIRLWPLWASLSSKGQVANQRREALQRQGRSSQETIIQPCRQGPGYASRVTYNRYLWGLPQN